jgi:hypothetical protein
MWCRKCQQDVPGVAHAASGRIVCARCQQTVRRKRPVARARICDDGLALDEQPAAAVTAAAPFRPDDWQGRQRMRSLVRELRRPATTAIKTSASTFGDRRRFEPPQESFGQIDRRTIGSATVASPLPAAIAAAQARRTEASQIVAWLIVIVGAIALAGGIGLIAWSLSTRQMLYWNLALGLALGGQGTLILGLVLVASRLWRHSRFAAGKLQEVHSQLGELQQTAEILTTMRSGGAPAFYADLVRGASPHVLLTNLKGQLDQLATRLGSGL